MRKISVNEFHEELHAQGVSGREHLALKCPVCGTIQSGTSLIRAGAGTTMDEVERFLGFSCVGRFTDAGPHRKDTPSGGGCDWTLGGLFKLHELEVEMPDGTVHPTFEPASAEEAQALEANWTGNAA
jgi:hypothetical protein